MVLSPTPTRWRLLVYLGAGIVIFWIIFLKLGGVVPEHFASFAAWRDGDAFSYFMPSFIITGFIVSLLCLFIEPVFFGIAQHKSKLAIAEDIAVSVATTAASVAIDVALDAVIGSSSDDSASGEFKAGGGSFGGGGASGNF
jgi:hypothetical protein